jgi:calcium/calmodulin-dependent protein kinase (CaM kinase) II
MPNYDSDELIDLNRRLLKAVDEQDWSTYTELCDPSLTAFEPEAVGHLVAGMDFHKFYFDRPSDSRALQSNICDASVRFLDEIAIVCYVRLTQRVDERGRTSTAAFEETRIWQNRDGDWKHVHFHRSRCGRAR